MEFEARSGYGGDRSLPLLVVLSILLLLSPESGNAADDTLLGALARAYQTIRFSTPSALVCAARTRITPT